MDTSTEQALEKEIGVIKYLLAAAAKHKDPTERTNVIEAHISTVPADVQDFFYVYIHMNEQQLQDMLIELRKKENLCIERTNTLVAMEAAEETRPRGSSFSKVVEEFEQVVCKARDAIYDTIDASIEKGKDKKSSSATGGSSSSDDSGRVRSKSIVEAFEDVVVDAANAIHDTIDHELEVEEETVRKSCGSDAGGAAAAGAGRGSGSNQEPRALGIALGSGNVEA